MLRFAQQRWPSSCNCSACGVPKIFWKFAIFSRELGAKFAWSRRWTFAFIGSECHSAFSNPQWHCAVCAPHHGRVHAIFWARDVPNFRNFANFSPDFSASFARSRRWNRALSCIRTVSDSKKRCKEMLRFQCTSTLAEYKQLYCAQRAEIFLEFAFFFFFHESLAQNLRGPDAGRLLFSDLNAFLTLSTISDIVQCAQGTMAECTQFFERGACRTSGNFANFSPDFCADFAWSRRLPRVLSFIRKHIDSKIGATNCYGLRNNAGRVHATSLRAARRKFAGNLQFFSRELGATLRDPDAGRSLFSDLNAILPLSTLIVIVKCAHCSMAEWQQLFEPEICWKIIVEKNDVLPTVFFVLNDFFV